MAASVLKSRLVEDSTRRAGAGDEIIMPGSRLEFTRAMRDAKPDPSSGDGHWAVGGDEDVNRWRHTNRSRIVSHAACLDGDERWRCAGVFCCARPRVRRLSGGRSARGSVYRIHDSCRRSPKAHRFVRRKLETAFAFCGGRDAVRAVGLRSLPFSYACLRPWGPGGWDVEQSMHLHVPPKRGVDLIDCSSGAQSRRPRSPITVIQVSSRSDSDEAGIAPSRRLITTRPGQCDRVHGRRMRALAQLLRDPYCRSSPR